VARLGDQLQRHHPWHHETRDAECHSQQSQNVSQVHAHPRSRVIRVERLRPCDEFTETVPARKVTMPQCFGEYSRLEPELRGKSGAARIYAAAQ
jgi:hypothetical protein